jgi:recombination protein RecT
MFAGLQKKVRNSGELKELTCEVVLQADAFRYWIDDAGAHITHEPNLEADDRGRFKAVYCIAKTHDGGVYMEVMTRGQVEQVRSVSKSKDSGPWASWFDEMARKTVFRRLSKRLPMSTDIEQAIRRDDNLYELAKPQQAALANNNSGVSAAKALLGIGSTSSSLLDAQPEGSGSQDDDESEYVPHFATDTAVAAIKSARTMEELEKFWVQINVDYDESDRELHPDIEDCYKACKQVLLGIKAGA